MNQHRLRLNRGPAHVRRHDMAEISRDLKPRTTLKDLTEEDRDAKELTEQEADAAKGGLISLAVSDDDEDPRLP
jgi:hypothetical protein